MSDIVERLRANTNHCIRSGQFDAGLCVECEAADEIERLRSLIAEWADADDGDLPFNEKYHECTCDKRFCVAARSLRKAVGR